MTDCISFRPTGPRVALLALLAVLAGSALALDVSPDEIDGAGVYDPKIKTPSLATAVEFKTHLRQSFEAASQKSIIGRMRIGGMQWVNLQWQLNRMKQAGQPLPDLSEFGVAKQADGSYVVDIAKNPQWQLWYRALADLAEPELYGLHAKKLRARGLRDRDLQVIQDYVQQNAQLAVPDSDIFMIRSIRAHSSRAPRFVSSTPSDAASYAYQFDRAREQSKQRWAAGLLERLDKRSQRILISYFSEISGTIFFIPDVSFDRSVEQFTESIVSGRAEQSLLQQQKELRQ